MEVTQLEEIGTILRKTPILFIKRLVGVELFFAILPFLAVAITGLRENYDSSGASQVVSYTFLVAIILATLQILILIVTFLIWYVPAYEINRQRILHRRFNLFEDKDLVDTQTITHIDLKRGPLGSRFDYGNLLISSEASVHAVVVKDIANPTRYAKLIESLVEKEQAPQPLPVARPVPALIAEGETQFVEFKSSLMWDYRRQLVNKGLYEPVMKNVVAFMNSTGGTLLIGVDDEGAILGLEPDFQAIHKPGADGFENVFSMAFNKMIGVEFRRFVDLTFPEIEGKQVCVVSIRPATQPAYLVYKGQEKFYIRAGNASQPLTVSQAARYIQDHFGQ